MPDSSTSPQEPSAEGMQIVDESHDPFVIIPTSFLDQWAAAIGPSAFLVYVALKRHANDRQRCWPSKAGLAARLGLSVPTVSRCLRTLKDHGLLTTTTRWDEHGGQMANLITLLRPPAVAAPSDEGPKKTDPVSKVQPPPGKKLIPKLEPVQLEPPLSSFQEERENAAPKKKAAPYPTKFEAFWMLYPKTNGSKKATFTRWKRLSEKKQDAAIEALGAFKECDNWRRGFIPYPERYIRDELWENPPEPAAIVVMERAPAPGSLEELLTAQARLHDPSRWTPTMQRDYQDPDVLLAAQRNLARLIVKKRKEDSP